MTDDYKNLNWAWLASLRQALLVLSVLFLLSACNGSNISSVTLEWEIPEFRNDGRSLGIHEIDRYVIRYGNKALDFENRHVVDSALVTSYQIDNLTSGVYYFAVSTVDSEGLKGQESVIVMTLR